MWFLCPFIPVGRVFVSPFTCLRLQTPKIFCIELFFSYILIKFFPSPNLNGPHLPSNSILCSLYLSIKMKSKTKTYKNIKIQISKRAKWQKKPKQNKIKWSHTYMHTQTTTTKAHRVTFTLPTTPGHRPGIEGGPYSQWHSIEENWVFPFPVSVSSSFLVRGGTLCPFPLLSAMTLSDLSWGRSCTYG